MEDAHAHLAELIGPPDPLRRRLAALSSVLTFANTGAHPDDEQNGLLAALRFGWGVRTVVMCSTRGEGGQNILGPEREAALGVLRTREMEIAAERIGAEIVWLGHGTDDPIHDFGFSKSGEDTLARWGEARLLDRLVRAYRTQRPDIVLPTFLDVPGQHGHHRAMTRAAFAAIAMAADPAYAADGLAAWQVSKFYLPAWSGAGLSYDDEAPPPAATVVLEFAEGDPVSGARWCEMGEYSRAAHASQGMGRWDAAGRDRWPLHLAWPRSVRETDLRCGLPADLAALARTAGAPPLLGQAALAVSRTQAAWPDLAAIRMFAEVARLDVEVALAEAGPEWLALHGHRLERKRSELATLFEPPAAVVRADRGGQAAMVRPDRVIVDLASPAPIVLAVTGAPRLDLPRGWQADIGREVATLTPPGGLVEGLTTIAVLAGDRPALRQTVIDYPHTGPLLHLAPQTLRVLALRLVRPRSVVAVLSGPGDRLGGLLSEMGLDVTEIPDGAPLVLDGFTTVVVGLQAFATRAGLAGQATVLHRFAERGGHLVTMMHRAQDNWPSGLFPIEIGSPSLRFRACTPDAPVEMMMRDHMLLAGPNRIVPVDFEGWSKERGLYFAKSWSGAYEPLLSMADLGEAPLHGALLSARIGKGRHTHTGLALGHQLSQMVPGAVRLMANLVQPA